MIHKTTFALKHYSADSLADSLVQTEPTLGITHHRSSTAEQTLSLSLVLKDGKMASSKPFSVHTLTRFAETAVAIDVKWKWGRARWSADVQKQTGKRLARWTPHQTNRLSRFWSRRDGFQHQHIPGSLPHSRRVNAAVSIRRTRDLIQRRGKWIQEEKRPGRILRSLKDERERRKMR